LIKFAVLDTQVMVTEIVFPSIHKLHHLPQTTLANLDMSPMEMEDVFYNKLSRHVQKDILKIPVEFVFCLQLYAKLDTNLMETVIAFLLLFILSVQLDTRVMETESAY
jgi:hypothetical protein